MHLDPVPCSVFADSRVHGGELSAVAVRASPIDGLDAGGSRWAPLARQLRSLASAESARNHHFGAREW